MNGEICLIVPPSIFLLDERVFMNLGILKVAAVLEKAGIAVDVLDLSGIENYLDVVTDYVAVSDCRTFGITATTPQMPAVDKIARLVRSLRPDARLILGGPHGTLISAAAKREIRKNGHGPRGRAAAALNSLLERFDVLVTGDGERAIFEALTERCANVVDADDPKTSLFLTDDTLDQTPWPARHLVDVSSYHYFIDGERALSLIAQLGCPFGCGFCGGRYSPFLRRIRTRSVDNIMAEVRYLYSEFGVKGFMFYDDELNVSVSMVDMMHKLADLQDELGVAFKLRGFIKSQLFMEEQASAMYHAGFRWILVGFESGSPRILRNINKRATREENSRCLEIARRNGLKVKALMSLGHPGESEETIADTRDWLSTEAPDDFDATIITVYPGTPYYDDATLYDPRKKIWVYSYHGDNLYSYEVDYQTVAEYYKGEPDGGYQAFVFTDHLSSDDLVRMRDDLEREIRAKLRIPFNPTAPVRRYEHSMGQGGGFPVHILKTSGT